MPDRRQQRTTHQRTLRVNPFLIRVRPEQLALARQDEESPQSQREEPTQDAGQLQGVYIISVAARLLEMHPQTLRKYERLGLVRPFRTIGMLRLYSEEDIQKLRLIKHLEENLGLNLAGVEFTLQVLSDLLDMLQRLSRLDEAESFFNVLEHEMAELFKRLNLPL